jgi:hypothetical protein
MLYAPEGATGIDDDDDDGDDDDDDDTGLCSVHFHKNVVFISILLLFVCFHRY